MKARNYIGQINIYMIIINRFCDFCHKEERSTINPGMKIISTL